jgi:hypothetical protein
MTQIPFCTRITLRSVLTVILISNLALGGGVASANQRPILTISGTPPSGVLTGQSYSFTPTAYDSRTRTLVFAISNRPSWATFSSSSGQLSGTPTTANVGTYSNIVIAVSDGSRTATLPAFSVQVGAAAATAPAPAPVLPPVISGTPPTSVQAGSSYAFQPTASDPSGLTLSFSVQNKPAWATFSIVNGSLGGTPSSSQAGVYANVIISASDGQSASALPAFQHQRDFRARAGGHRYGVARSDEPTRNPMAARSPILRACGFITGPPPTNLTQVVQPRRPCDIQLYRPATSHRAPGISAPRPTSTGTESALSPIVSKTIP